MLTPNSQLSERFQSGNPFSHRKLSREEVVNELGKQILFLEGRVQESRFELERTRKDREQMYEELHQAQMKIDQLESEISRLKYEGVDSVQVQRLQRQLQCVTQANKLREQAIEDMCVYLN
ncbi:hypothetical protein GUITHDRAFT_138818 [Guillardia theta CCMP2712]|uniref:Uncharacterized protein n=1 Tax=Guillardia theta (strain CCMP2712) TaxID=905079 RepID=L1JBX0_GUITC|nr:hypothetical protein GUITHDRAFT_138818 [Guillardia theta CCMP2712]EKX45595.1 hypothetical protein GUITHDRAFT_138818 [Guillardia theta CCMP2712]|eukprot:XP_005832575.1 hypothetical protein GUITHDRAFT_138818 [Guillardia theta CCMP2712]